MTHEEELPRMTWVDLCEVLLDVTAQGSCPLRLSVSILNGSSPNKVQLHFYVMDPTIPVVRFDFDRLAGGTLRLTLVTSQGDRFVDNNILAQRWYDGELGPYADYIYGLSLAINDLKFGLVSKQGDDTLLGHYHAFASPQALLDRTWPVIKDLDVVDLRVEVEDSVLIISQTNSYFWEIFIQEEGAPELQIHGAPFTTPEEASYVFKSMRTATLIYKALHELTPPDTPSPSMHLHPSLPSYLETPPT